jgi:S-adenosylmethionine synthetase
MVRQYLFSSESVSEGHPDKLADQISDAVLDAHLEQDPLARVACETMLAKDLVVVAGEISSRASVDIEAIVRQTIEGVGYADQQSGFDYRTCEIQTSISRQSSNISSAVSHDGGSLGAGDQGMMFGYAVNETPELMPLPISLAHKLMQRHAVLRRSGSIPWLRPDAKTQVTVRYIGLNPVAVEKVVLSTQHARGVSDAEIENVVKNQIIDEVIRGKYHTGDMQYIINPSGEFTTGGPAADTGLTGRKIIVDTYGGSCPHGGGAFSGKDPTKVDRSAAYMARYIAKNIVAAGLAQRCLVQLAYAIGQADPVSVMLDTQQTGEVDEASLESIVRKIFNLRPGGIIDTLDLRRPIYRKTASFGHFGRELPEFNWKKTDKVEALRKSVSWVSENTVNPGTIAMSAGR